MIVDCHAQHPGVDGYMKAFSRRVLEQRVPVNGSFDLTERCNLACQHCYLDPSNDSPSGEMKTSEVLYVLDQIAEAGCLNLLLTGGEPLIRRDFPEIYRHAKHNGMLIDVFTNGTLITEDIADLFRDLPPVIIEITMHGSSPEVFDRIAGKAGSYEKAWEGIRRLIARQVRTGLKMVVMKNNIHQFDEIRQRAADEGISFRFDTSVFKRFNGDSSPVDFRVSFEEAVELDFRDPDRLRKWADYIEDNSPVSAHQRLYVCGAGIQSFHVTAQGFLTPCVMIRDTQYDLKKGSFMDGWLNVIPEILNRVPPAHYECNTCSSSLWCGYCPAFFQIENGSETRKSQYLCQAGQLRHSAYADFIKKARS